MFFFTLINPKSSGRRWNPCVEIRYANSLTKKAAKLMCTFLPQLTDMKIWVFFSQRINAWKLGRDFFLSILWINLNYFLLIFFLLQYYEMSYGLNVEMHKQVRLFHWTLIFCLLRPKQILQAWVWSLVQGETITSIKNMSSIATVSCKLSLFT